MDFDTLAVDTPSPGALSLLPTIPCPLSSLLGVPHPPPGVGLFLSDPRHSLSDEGLFQRHLSSPHDAIPKMPCSSPGPPLHSQRGPWTFPLPKTPTPLLNTLSIRFLFLFWLGLVLKTLNHSSLNHQDYRFSGLQTTPESIYQEPLTSNLMCAKCELSYKPGIQSHPNDITNCSGKKQPWDNAGTPLSLTTYLLQ